MRAASYRRRPASLGRRALRRDRRGEPVRGFQQRMVVGLGAAQLWTRATAPATRWFSMPWLPIGYPDCARNGGVLARACHATGAVPRLEARRAHQILDRRPLRLSLEVVTRAAPSIRKPRCSAVSEALCRTRTGDPFLTMAVRPGRPASCEGPKRLHSRKSGTRQEPASHGRFGHCPLPTRYPGRSQRSRAVGSGRNVPEISSASPCKLGRAGQAVAFSIRASRAPAEGNARGRSRSARLGNRDGPSPHGRRARRSSRRGRPGTAG
jgi:hypothetical protein